MSVFVYISVLCPLVIYTCVHLYRVSHKDILVPKISGLTNMLKFSHTVLQLSHAHVSITSFVYKHYFKTNLTQQWCKIISTGFGAKTCILPQVQTSANWTLLPGPSYRVMTGLIPTQVWLIWKNARPSCFMVCFGWRSSTAFIPLSYQSFGSYSQSK